MKGIKLIVHIGMQRTFTILENRHIDRKIKLLKNYKTQIIIKKSYFSGELIKG